MANICTGRHTRATPTRMGSLQPGHAAGGGAPTGNSGHESFWDRGEVRSDRCHSAAAINPSPLLLPAGRRDAGGAELPASYAGTCSRGCATGQRGASPEKPSEAEPAPGGGTGPWGSSRCCRAGSCRRRTVAAGQSGAGGGSRGSGSRAPWSWGAGATARSALIELLLLQGDCYFIGLFLAALPG